MVKAVGKRIVGREIAEEEPEKKGILILPTERKYVRALVIATGSEVDRYVQEGDIVILPPDTGIMITINGVSYISFQENQILACVEGNGSDS